MPVLSTPLTLDQGADFFASFVWLRGPTLYSALPVDLTGATAEMMARVEPTDASPLFTITDQASASGQVLLGATAGTVGILVAAAVTAALPPASTYSLKLFAPTNGSAFPDGTRAKAFLLGSLYVTPNPVR